MSKLARLATTGGARPVYVEDVFSTYLYTGNGSTQTINNGIDLAGKGGLVWIKKRNTSTNGWHILSDTARGTGNTLYSNSTSGQATGQSSVTAFGSSGFTIGSLLDVNTYLDTFASWTFRKAPKFFDIVSYSGNGVARNISHNLGSVPGCIIIKCLTTTSDWAVYHRSLSNSQYLWLNSDNTANTNSTYWNSTTPTADVFTVGTNSAVNSDGVAYVAYLFAHDTDPDGLIQCGSYVAEGTSTQAINLGWEPQFIIRKRSDGISSWDMFDVMRGAVNASTSSRRLQANDVAAEDGSTFIYPTATGFIHNTIGTAGYNYIYLAIRRPNKPPTSGTEVFNITQTTASSGTDINTVGFPIDMQIATATNTGASRNVYDRLRGVNTLDNTTFQTPSLSTQSVSTEGTNTTLTRYWDNQGFSIASAFTGFEQLYLNFRRAPGFFDIVATSSAGSSTPHNLGVAPELIIGNSRNENPPAWGSYTQADNVRYLGPGFNTTNGPAQTQTGGNVNTSTTFNTLYVYDSSGNGLNTTAFPNSNFIYYLFASLPGISKVGSYAGNGGTVNTNGTSQTINCNFSTGARFLLIRGMSSGSNWYIFAKGIVAASDSYFLLNNTDPEVTTVDAVDPNSSGFIVNQTSGTNLNVTSATYIFLAIA